jgi:hypothetical protein
MSDPPVVHKLSQRTGQLPGTTPSQVTVHKLNRDLFIKWTEGILLERDRAGKCTVLDGSDFNERCESALKALEEGHTVYLTERSGMPITRLTVLKKLLKLMCVQAAT